jgi:hypothetical protein
MKPRSLPGALAAGLCLWFLTACVRDLVASSGVVDFGPLPAVEAYFTLKTAEPDARPGFFVDANTGDRWQADFRTPERGLQPLGKVVTAESQTGDHLRQALQDQLYESARCETLAYSPGGVCVVITSRDDRIALAWSPTTELRTFAKPAIVKNGVRKEDPFPKRQVVGLQSLELGRNHERIARDGYTLLRSVGRTASFVRDDGTMALLLVWDHAVVHDETWKKPAPGTYCEVEMIFIKDGQPRRVSVQNWNTDDFVLGADITATADGRIWFGANSRELLVWSVSEVGEQSALRRVAGSRNDNRHDIGAFSLEPLGAKVVVGWLDTRAAYNYPRISLLNGPITAHLQMAVRTVTNDEMGPERLLSTKSGSVYDWVMRAGSGGVTLGWVVKTVDPDDPLKTVAGDPGRLQGIFLPGR